jgi:hypothetical protein
MGFAIENIEDSKRFRKQLTFEEDLITKPQQFIFSLFLLKMVLEFNS